MLTVFENEHHKNVMFSDLTSGSMVQANQHVILHNNEVMILDPGGHKVYSKLFASLSKVAPVGFLKYIVFSHQDPDIVASANAWLMVSKADAFLPSLWMRFITHFGVDELVMSRIHPVPDEGMLVDLGGVQIKLIGAHFLHSAGNIQVYDPISKILYSGDLGASLGAPYEVVEDFDQHIQYMEAFHKRYIPSSKACQMWVNTVNELDIEMIVPQHGAIFKGRQMVGRFIEWIDNLKCGLDIMGESFPVP